MGQLPCFVCTVAAVPSAILFLSIRSFSVVFSWTSISKLYCHWPHFVPINAIFGMSIFCTVKTNPGISLLFWFECEMKIVFVPSSGNSTKMHKLAHKKWLKTSAKMWFSNRSMGHSYTGKESRTNAKKHEKSIKNASKSYVKSSRKQWIPVLLW